jgi:S-adenosylmethionine:tRNA ribosyltransferase-isomerase
MKTTDFDYILPPELIAQTPIEPRDNSRLMVYHKKNNSLEHILFHEIGNVLTVGDLLVINKTRVIPARIFAKKPTGGKVEILLIRKLSELEWEVLIGGKKIRTGMILSIAGGNFAEVTFATEDIKKIVRFQKRIEESLSCVGQMPLPPYIHEKLKDPERYQTVYAQVSGSAAAPTAGLHFTNALMSSLRKKGIEFTEVTLHVGLDTFAPVTEEDPREHRIHTEWCSIPSEAKEKINLAKKEGRRVIAVGTTTVRTLESGARCANKNEWVGEMNEPTDLFILPGYSFRVVGGMITNFHLPKSSLIMLVSAFTGREKILQLYQTAIEKQYRFYSFGDAMLII